MENQDHAREGRVVARYGIHIAVEDANDDIWRCHIRKCAGFAVAGDRVLWRPTDDAFRTGIISSVLTRRTLLQRCTEHGRQKPVAANIDQLFVVSACVPPPDMKLIDLYLVNAEILDIRALLIINKSDLQDASARRTLEQQFSLYSEIGYPVMWTSIHSIVEMANLESALRNQVNILVGQSGVGKSSLIDTLLPTITLQRAALSEATQLGRHTTSAATLYRLPHGGAIIDSPGVRHFASCHLPADSIAGAFPEFRTHLDQCRFSDCRHLHETGCAIRGALAAGQIAPGRYQSYCQLIELVLRTQARQFRKQGR
jgi:ribosome biogenesis GTPase